MSQSSNNPQEATLQGGIPKLSYKGDITFFAQAYTPAAPGVKLTPGSTKLYEMEDLAKEFENHQTMTSAKFQACLAWLHISVPNNAQAAINSEALSPHLKELSQSRH
ncbi:hypothetical protein NZD89_18425 [Alicyclobacillus fastidiosus]|uniref:Uncharacterized protein n=1 Tax=Alicyclobacillus fastidiosus TaxID=392011 RepID=A0ABY6ZC32_9BACL|nr:hypothetical protein [Alicyclobacillus fastidiosus]WAH40333.1 hypothetical protein NZD89_18425 [Alicyclobacillus fastidiosus]